MRLLKIRWLLKKLRVQKLTKTELQSAYNNFYLQNIQKLAFATILIIPISLLHILIFTLKSETNYPNEIIWRNGIITSHIISVIILLIIIFLIQIWKRKDSNTTFSIIISHVSFIIMLSVGVAVSGIDQLVTSAINPYFLVCLFIPLIITLPPLYMVAYYIISVIEFFFILPIYQADKNIILSNLVNACSSAGFGITLSYILWKMNISKFKADETIKKQNQTLEFQNQQLVLLSDDLKKSNSSKDKYFSVLAHDLRGPIHGFLGLSEIIAEDISSFSVSELKEIARAMKISASNIFNLLNNLLEWSRLQQGHLLYNPVQSDLNKLIIQAIETNGQSLNEKNISVRFEPEYNVEALVDEHMMSLVFRNILSNAIKFSHKSSFILISLKLNSNTVSVAIQDFGIGMSPDVADSLFKISESINRKGTSGEASTGLGLVLCKEFIEQHNGNISIITEENVGTTFLISFPVS